MKGHFSDNSIRKLVDCAVLDLFIYFYIFDLFFYVIESNCDLLSSTSNELKICISFTYL